MNGRFQMQRGKNWIFPKEMNANRFFWDSHRLEIWSNYFCPSVGPNGVCVAMDSELLLSMETLHSSKTHIWTLDSKAVRKVSVNIY